MPRKARELSALEVRRLVEVGLWSVGGVDGLASQVTGPDAREQARAARAQARTGDDPISKRQAAKMAAEECIAQHEKSWKSFKHAGPWAATLGTLAYPVLGAMFLRVRPEEENDAKS